MQAKGLIITNNCLIYQNILWLLNAQELSENLTLDLCF